MDIFSHLHILQMMKIRNIKEQKTLAKALRDYRDAFYVVFNTQSLETYHRGRFVSTDSGPELRQEDM